MRRLDGKAALFTGGIPCAAAHGLLFIDGDWREPRSPDRVQVVCPSTEQVVAEVADAGPEDVDAAVRAARRSFAAGAWRDMGVQDRADVLEHAFRLLEPGLSDLAPIVTSEMGLPISLALKQVPGSLALGRYFLDLGTREESVELRPGPVTTAAVFKEPVGVVAAISPWNGPFHSLMLKAVPALLAGCSVVYKPAAETPLDGFLFTAALARAGVPAGVFNFLTGDRDAGRAMVAHPEIDKVSFTGSTAAGRQIGEECGRAFKRVALELGGKSAAIILDDADIGTVTAGIVRGSFSNSGQLCAAYTRILVPRSREAEFTDAIVAAAESLVVGDPFDPATTMGPLVSARQLERVRGYIAAGIAEGARVLTGGGRPSGLDVGCYVEPTVFGSADNSMRICREEIFGPVIALIAYDSVEQAIAIANDSPYGLHGGVFTADPRAALAVAGRVRTGTFSVNAFVYNTAAPFGGVKCSGIGRDTGPEGLNSFYELKTVNLSPGMESLFH